MKPWDFPAEHGWRWLDSTSELQHDVFGYDLVRLAQGASPEQDKFYTGDLTKYLDWNVTAAQQELAELREEFSWKPWAKDEPFVNRDRIIAEAVDVLHFLGNILVGLGATDYELEEEYKKKQRINVQRATSGTYSAKKGGLSQGSD